MRKDRQLCFGRAAGAGEDERPFSESPMILSSSFSIYFHAFFPRVPVWHWAVIGGVALVLGMLMRVRRRVSVPGAVMFGLFLSGFFLATGKGRWRSLWMATLAGLGLSLLIESIQLVFHIGIFELTDLLLNTFGTFVGAALPLGGRFLDAILLKFFTVEGIID